MKRRDVIRSAAGFVVAWRHAALAQQARRPTVGFFRSTGRQPFENIVVAFETGLKDVGFVDGVNVQIEYRWADNQLDRLPGLARELLEIPVDVVVGNSLAIDAMRAVTSSLPMVFVIADDPVRSGYVANLSRPGANMTGVTFFGGSQLNAKRLELLNDVAPGTSTIVALNDADYPDGEAGLEDARNAARLLGRPFEIVEVSGRAGFDNAFAQIANLGAGALLVNGSPLFTGGRRRIVELTNGLGIPAIFDQRAFVEAGGFMSYGASFTNAYRQAGDYVGRILTGQLPGDLPVQRPTVLELIVNAKTARELGVSLPQSIVVRADEIIE